MQGTDVAMEEGGVCWAARVATWTARSGPSAAAEVGLGRRCVLMAGTAGNHWAQQFCSSSNQACGHLTPQLGGPAHNSRCYAAWLQKRRGPIARVGQGLHARDRGGAAIDVVQARWYVCGLLIGMAAVRAVAAAAAAGPPNPSPIHGHLVIACCVSRHRRPDQPGAGR